MDPIRIVIADDHQIVRMGIKSLLTSSPDVEVIGEVADGKALVENVRNVDSDLILSDILMPGMSGIEAVQEIRTFDRNKKVVMLTSLEDKVHLAKAMNAGANGYLSKEVGKVELIDAIKAVWEGGRVFSSSILEIMANPEVSISAYTLGEPDHSNVYLSNREQEIITLISEGYTSKEIGDKLFISPRTVDTHRKNLMAKLQVKNTAGLVRFALLHLP